MEELNKELREAQFAYFYPYTHRVPSTWQLDLVNIDNELGSIIGLIRHIVPWK
jgi:hypothetical protein